MTPDDQAAHKIVLFLNRWFSYQRRQFNVSRIESYILKVVFGLTDADRAALHSVFDPATESAR
jgi:hypothetical protein